MPRDQLGGAAMASTLSDPHRVAVGQGRSGNHAETLLMFLMRRNSAGILGAHGLPPSIGAAAMSASVRGHGWSATWTNGGPLSLGGGAADPSSTAYRVATALSSRATVEARDACLLAALSTSSLAANSNPPKQSGELSSLLVLPVPADPSRFADQSASRASLEGGADAAPEPWRDPGPMVRAAVIPAWGMPPHIVPLQPDGTPDISSKYWSSPVMVPGLHALLADIMEPQPVNWSAISSNGAWSTNRVGWHIGPRGSTTMSVSESVDTAVGLLTSVFRSYGGGAGRISMTSHLYPTAEDADRVLGARLNALAKEPDTCANSYGFSVPEAYEVVTRIAEDPLLWDASAVHLLATGITRVAIKWSAPLAGR